jgi:SSS family solute:Na+ symporter
MDIALFWLVFALIGIFSFMIALHASRFMHSEADFFYAERKLGVFALAASLAASQIGGAFLIVVPEESYFYGFYGFAYSLGLVSGLFILALFIGWRLHALNLKTSAEVFVRSYDSLFARRIASVLSILTLGTIFCSQILVSRKLFHAVIGSHEWLLIGFWLLLIAYTMFGGLRAVVASNIFHLFIISCVLFLLFILFVNHKSHGLLLAQVLKAGTNPLFTQAPPEKSWMLLLLPFFYLCLAQDSGQRFFAAKSPKVAALAAFLAALIVMSLSFILVFFSMAGRLMAPDTSQSGMIFLALVKNSMSPFVYYVAICAFIAAISSTADSLLCALGANVAQDFFGSRKNPHDTYASILLSRVLILLCGIFALIIAYSINDIVYLLSLGYELSITLLLVPIICGLIKPKLPKESAVFSMVFGLVAFFVFRFLSLPLPKELTIITCSCAGFVIGLSYAFLRTIRNKR